MRASELYGKRKQRDQELNKEAEQNADLWRLMYADFDYIHRNQSHLLTEIEAKIEELEQLRNEFDLMIEKSKLEFSTKENIKKMAQKRIDKIMRN